MKKRIIQLVFAVISFLAFNATFFAEIKISNESFDVGMPITVYSDNDLVYTYIWKVNGKVIDNSNNYYIPTASDYESWIEVSAWNKGKKAFEKKIYFSKLPVVYINTNQDKEKITREEFVDGNLVIQGNFEFTNQYDGEVEVKGRGTSSWHYDKKPYKLKLDKKTDLFGFGKSKHYVLLANYLDPSLMRNKIGFDLSEKLGLVSTDSIWVDVVFNGEYIGNYQLCEHVRIGKQLVNITDIEDIAEEIADSISEQHLFNKKNTKKLEELMNNDLSWITNNYIDYNGVRYNINDYYDGSLKINGGYLFEFDSDGTKDISNFQTNKGVNVIISKPEYALTNNEIMKYLQDYFNYLEEAVYSIDGYNKLGKHYTEYVDFDSLVSYWLTMELLSNEDASSRSRFAYKEIDGKLTFGPVWDFDISSGSYRSFSTPKGFNVTGTFFGKTTGQDFWKEIVDDPYFQIKAAEKYWKIRDYLDEIIKDGGLIDQYEDYLYESAISNEILWHETRSFSGKRGEVALYKDFLKERIKWFDKIFKNDNSTTKNLYLNKSSNKYQKSSKIKITINNSFKDESLHGSDFIINKNNIIDVNIKTKNVDYLSIYINGIKYNSYNNFDSSLSILLSSDSLKLNNNSKNIISVIGKKGNKTYTNYVTFVFNATNDSKVVFDDKEKCSADISELTKIEKRKYSDMYGLKEGYYSNKCHTYYNDKYEKIRPKNIIYTMTSCNSIMCSLGIRQYIILFLIVVIILFTITSIYIFKNKNKN